jgi:hypothetical protein
VDHSYSCAAVNPPERIAAGESVEIEVACDTEERQDRLVDEIVIYSDDPLLPRLALEVQASIEPRLAFVSPAVELRTPFGQKDSQEVRLRGTLAAAARLEVAAVDPPGPEVKIVPAGQQGPQGLRLTLDGVRVTRGAGQVRVTTALRKPETLTLLYSWQVLGNLTIDPTNPYIDLRLSGPVGAEVKVSSSRPDFRLKDAVVVDGPFEASFGRDDSTRGYLVRVRVREDRVPDGERGLLGTLRLTSNDPAEPRKEVRLFALGASGNGGR